ncbi:MAG: Na(+)-translocating NADH-quinone reductase subunit C [Planctomycetes bacterium]|nr:Na(+)-translocating NADH-quinone reductase subunit C [Planctomycetota bacterium]
MDYSNKYIVTFAAVLCLVCSTLVSSIAVGLKDRQEVNRILDKRTMILRVANLVGDKEKPSIEEVNKFFEAIETKVVDFKTGALVDVDPTTVDPRKNAKAAGKSSAIVNPWAKKAGIKSVADQQLIYLVRTPGKECVVFPYYGNGLWSAMYGFMCVTPDLAEVIGIIYYEQGETAGLGGEVENPLWRARWKGKKALSADNELLVEVVKSGLAKDPTTQVDGIAGATITSVAVTYALKFWFGEQGYGPALDDIRAAAQEAK